MNINVQKTRWIEREREKKPVFCKICIQMAVLLNVEKTITIIFSDVDFFVVIL